jgi:hypothetical protein
LFCSGGGWLGGRAGAGFGQRAHTDAFFTDSPNFLMNLQQTVCANALIIKRENFRMKANQLTA